MCEASDAAKARTQRIWYAKGVTDRCDIFADVTKTVGQTPIVKLNRIAPPGVNLYAKLEYFNPLGSVKDRIAVGIIEDAERKGLLTPGGTVVEATSGNTGIGLAMVCAQRGYQLVVVMSETYSVERRKIMRMMGAKVLLTPADLGSTQKAEELAKKHGWFLARQYESEANSEYHEQTTGPEIVEAFKAANLTLDFWVTGYGTGGTFAGCASYFRKSSPKTTVVLVEPEEAPLIASGKVQSRKAVMGEFGAPAMAHPDWKPHELQGWSPNFLAKLTEDALVKGLHDWVTQVNGKASMETTRRLAEMEGVFCGPSGGATVLAALDVCQKAPPGSNVLAMIPDTAERYLTTSLFDHAGVEMTAEEMLIVNSTPLGAAPPV